MGKHEQIIPTAPPAGRAPRVLEQRAAIERELADLKLQIAETALAAFENKSGGREKLAALDAKIRACTFQAACTEAAHELAVRLDREAVAAWKAACQADPKRAIEGISKNDCCRRCGPEHGCVISTDTCAHPIKAGPLAMRLQGNTAVRAVYRAATEKLGVYR